MVNRNSGTDFRNDLLTITLYRFYMEYSVVANSLEEAEDLFLLAKDRLLDINEWHSLCANGTVYTLMDKHKQKVHRNAHTHDLIKKSNGSDECYFISGIVYDDFPDVAGETLSLLLQPETSATDEHLQAIIVKRIGKVLWSTAQNLSIGTEAMLKNMISTGELV